MVLPDTDDPLRIFCGFAADGLQALGHADKRMDIGRIHVGMVGGREKRFSRLILRPLMAVSSLAPGCILNGWK